MERSGDPEMMNDNRIMSSPTPTPVLNYEVASPKTPFWTARLMCGMAIANGTVSIGYVVACRIFQVPMPVRTPGAICLSSPAAWR